MTKSTRSNDKSASTKNNSKTNETESNKTKNKPNKVSKKQKNDAQNASSRKRTSSKKKKTSNHPVLHLTCYCALFFILLAILLFDIDQVDTVAMQPALHKDDIVVSFAPPFVHPTPAIGQIYHIHSENEAPNFLRLISCGEHTVTYDEDVIRLNGKAMKRLKLTNDAIARPADAPEIWRESLESGQQWRIMLPQLPIRSHLHGSVTLSANTCFAAGDNRMSSYDSRHFGPIDQHNLTGKALFILHTTQSDGIFGPFIKLL